MENFMFEFGRTINFVYITAVRFIVRMFCRTLFLLATIVISIAYAIKDTKNSLKKKFKR